MSETAELARAVSTAIREATGLSAGPLVEPVRRHALHVVADTIGVSLAGGRTAEMTRLRESQLPAGGGATVWAPGAIPAPPEEAAFLNATAGSFLELDEGMRPTGHPAMHVVPAALAAAEVAHRSGAELLGAVVAGYEVAARLFTAFRLTPPTHPHGHLGGVGAAVAVALLLGEDPVAVAAIAATTPTVPVWNACYEGATARNTAMGLAAQNALRAARLHRAGFRGSPESVGALFGRVTGRVVDVDALAGAVDPARPAILRNYFKRHSACALTHGAIDAVLSLPAVPVEQITAVEVRTVANNLKLDRQAVPNDLSARFSLPYAVAAVLTARASDLSTFDYRPPVADLARLVSVGVDDELERQWPRHSPTRVVVHAGERLEASVTDPRGHHHDPLTVDEIHRKFLLLAGEPAPRLWDSLLALDRAPDVAGVLAPLREA
ncbi:MmgE/PrpD family protein [Pseudonocardia sichuanensis]